MEDLIKIEVIENGQGGHDDLLFLIPNLVDLKTFDTYYFSLAVEPVESIGDIKKAVANLVQFWIDKIEEIEDDQIIYLPIDLSDEYTGCLKVQKQQPNLSLTYGYSRREAYTVDPLDPEDYYNSINDFQAETEKQLVVDKGDFIDSLKKQKLNLIDNQ